MLISHQRRLYLFFFPVVMYPFFSGHNENFPRRLYLFFPVVIARTAHPSDRQLYLFFISGRNVSFFRLYLFFPVVIARTAHPTDRRLYLFFSGRNCQKSTPDRQTTVSFFFTTVSFFSGRNQNFLLLQKKC